MKTYYVCGVYSDSCYGTWRLVEALSEEHALQVANERYHDCKFTFAEER